MSDQQRKLLQLKPSQLSISMAFPGRENPPPLSSLKEEILEYQGLLKPLVVRPSGDKQFLVLDGRRRLTAIHELQDEGHEKLFRWLPCFVIQSDNALMDLKLFLVLNNCAPLGIGEFERALAAIEDATRRSSRPRR